jgi:prepilin-type N-terminal cleavage/methylation domain-containing protein
MSHFSKPLQELSHMKASLSQMKKQVQRGFTLVEIAIVLVIIGLLIGGVLRGQELLNSARVNSISSQQSAISTAYYGFIDRYRTMPGDLTAPQALLINNLTAPVALGNQADGVVPIADSAAFFNNLSQAGFISCTPCSAATIVTPGATAATAATYIPPVTLSGSNTMVNVYSAPLVFTLNPASLGGATAGTINFLASSAEIGKPMLTSGNTIQSNMLAELDRKSDDGNPSGGSFRYTDIGVNGVAAPYVAAAVSNACWALNGTTYSWSVNPPGNCQGITLF